jgi:hypothetical protein
METSPANSGFSVVISDFPCGMTEFAGEHHIDVRQRSQNTTSRKDGGPTGQHLSLAKLTSGECAMMIGPQLKAV